MPDELPQVVWTKPRPVRAHQGSCNHWSSGGQLWQPWTASSGWWDKKEGTKGERKSELQSTRLCWLLLEEEKRTRLSSHSCSTFSFSVVIIVILCTSDRNGNRFKKAINLDQLKVRKGPLLIELLILSAYSGSKKQVNQSHTHQYLVHSTSTTVLIDIYLELKESWHDRPVQIRASFPWSLIHKYLRFTWASWATFLCKNCFSFTKQHMQSWGRWQHQLPNL